jgi:hypothetical protein
MATCRHERARASIGFEPDPSVIRQPVVLSEARPVDRYGGLAAGGAPSAKSLSDTMHPRPMRN